MCIKLVPDIPSIINDKMPATTHSHIQMATKHKEIKYAPRKYMYRTTNRYDKSLVPTPTPITQPYKKNAGKNPLPLVTPL